LEKINIEVNKIIKTQDFRERMLKVGADPVGGSIEDFRQKMKSETDRWGRVIKAADIKPD
jgi:tripartite-type tricarboxylate transporter receptor subunit TctC